GALLPNRFAQRLCEHWLAARRPARPMKQFNLPQLREVAATLQAWPLVASGTEGYRTAEVTLGGVDTDGLSSTTMQSKRVPGLYFIGEVVDVTGWLGGYNFQWAWASAHACGTAIPSLFPAFFRPRFHRSRADQHRSFFVLINLQSVKSVAKNLRQSLASSVVTGVRRRSWKSKLKSVSSEAGTMRASRISPSSSRAKVRNASALSQRWSQ